MAAYSSEKPTTYDRYQRAALDALAKRGGIGHTTDLLRDGTRTTAITSLWRSGRLIRLKAGLYQLPEALPTQHAAIVQACAAVPNGVVAVVSALDFHGLTDANPEAVWVAVPLSSWAPKVSEPPVQYVRFRKHMFELGAEVHKVDSQAVRVYSREKTL